MFILLYCWQNISESKLKQQINVKVCEKIGNSVNEMLALIKLTYTEHAWKKSSGFEWHSQHKEMCVMIRKSGQPKTQQMQMRTVSCNGFP